MADVTPFGFVPLRQTRAGLAVFLGEADFGPDLEVVEPAVQDRVFGASLAFGPAGRPRSRGERYGASCVTWAS